MPGADPVAVIGKGAAGTLLRAVRWAVLATKIHDTSAAAGWLSADDPAGTRQ